MDTKAAAAAAEQKKQQKREEEEQKHRPTPKVVWTWVRVQLMPSANGCSPSPRALACAAFFPKDDHLLFVFGGSEFVGNDGKAAGACVLDKGTPSDTGRGYCFNTKTRKWEQPIALANGPLGSVGGVLACCRAA